MGLNSLDGERMKELVVKHLNTKLCSQEQDNAAKTHVYDQIVEEFARLSWYEGRWPITQFVQFASKKTPEQYREARLEGRREMTSDPSGRAIHPLNVL
ncbi:hypothetical protein PM082_006710 [Marasmius tenuissimus]|nr:hypothetical protein PM082_006710 [Marasmius tenuissimus]